MFNYNIYTKKYGSRIECGHWNYLMYIYDTNINSKKEQLLEKMLTIYVPRFEKQN